jgi:exodeoxyribonuclease VII small subunit
VSGADPRPNGSPRGDADAAGAGPAPAARAAPDAGAAPDPGPNAGTGTDSLTYEQAAARVEEIIRRLDSGEASLSETLALVSEGKQLIEVCAAELGAVGAALEELRLDELVSRLEREAGT